MKVYYDSSLWSSGKGLCGLPLRVNWYFEYAETKRCIPVVYGFQKGIVFDVITFLEQDKLHEFFEKYKTYEENLTPSEQVLAEQEHPYQPVPIMDIWINGDKVKGGYSSSSAISVPWYPKDDIIGQLTKSYSYILKDTASFACERFCVPYPREKSKMEILLHFLRLKKIHSIELRTRPVQQFYPLDIDFEMPNNENCKVVCFKHPTRGITHKLYFQNSEFVEVPIEPPGSRNFYSTSLMYEVEPSLPEGDTLQFDSSIQYTEPPNGDFGPTVTSSIGIIGGACGPTSIFISQGNKEKSVPIGLHGLRLHSCFAVPSFQKGAVPRFVIQGINIKKYDSQEYTFPRTN